MSDKLAGMAEALAQLAPRTLGSVTDAHLRDNGVAFWKMHHRLEACDPPDATSALRPLNDRRQRPVLLVIVSEQFDPVGPTDADPLDASQTAAERDRGTMDRLLGEAEIVVIAYPDDHPQHAPLARRAERWQQRAVEKAKPGAHLIWDTGKGALHTETIGERASKI